MLVIRDAGKKIQHHTIHTQPIGNRFDMVGLKVAFIRKTCPRNVYPLKPHFYIEKLGYAGVYLFFLFLLQNIDCGYKSDVYPLFMF